MDDLTGRKFGRLTVCRPLEERRHHKVVWECQCDCGKTVSVVSSYLKNGRTDSCGCLKRAIKRKPITDLTGQRFGNLVAISPTEERENGSVVWECRCDCGNTVFIKSGRLRHGGAVSCGCMPKRTTAKDLTGQRFGRLVVLRDSEKRSNKHVVWECQCDCGNTTYVKSSHLIDGGTLSCGCSWKKPLQESEKVLRTET